MQAAGRQMTLSHNVKTGRKQPQLQKQLFPVGMMPGDAAVHIVPVAAVAATTAAYKLTPRTRCKEQGLQQGQLALAWVQDQQLSLGLAQRQGQGRGQNLDLDQGQGQGGDQD